VRVVTERYLLGLLILSGLFVGALVVCNLIAMKFTEIDLGFHVFTVSVGILPYPLTFLVTDILSEVYGKRRANQVVLVGFVASVLVIGIVYLALAFPAMTSFGATDAAFDGIFGKTWRLITASMVAYLIAQLVDVQMFHFWKRLTKGKHLWLRNNASTIGSQLLDTIVVITILFWDDPKVTDDAMYQMIRDGWVFKMLCALADTPLVYAAVALFRRHVVPTTAPDERVDDTFG
jgi:queuosine precursor transporter